ncbi:MAG: hypothetical protein COU22_03550 [Candidatus Komeilibacteria bacterium CG10_big_fil_rev_8_21_14_0_10_41_13]|uniref:Uncharacterized protein n=1 Tax=Candidatus Komeilibacteria bacterium CG10_big_fil_rev_8_21_14_0_10_41_13 TaxID=1974476 RepID=A0A2M6WBX1_9BACT|nr:MAG: hypothetical protein COU22_03550 [Candidatus Komeilibacteria bacterium CG10_big_fil_rev_8_21_14_0_10_41_13]
MKTSLIGSKKDYDLILPYKCRIVDPWVDSWRLSEIDEEFKKKFEAEVARAKAGHYIKLNNLR